MPCHPPQSSSRPGRCGKSSSGNVHNRKSSSDFFPAGKVHLKSFLLSTSGNAPKTFVFKGFSCTPSSARLFFIFYFYFLLFFIFARSEFLKHTSADLCEFEVDPAWPGEEWPRHPPPLAPLPSPVVASGDSGIRPPRALLRTTLGDYLAAETRWRARDSPAGGTPAGLNYFGRRAPGPRRILHRRSVSWCFCLRPAGVAPTK